MTLTARRTTWAQAHIVTSWPVPSPTTVRARIGMIRLAAERRHQQRVDWKFDWKGAMGMCVNAPGDRLPRSGRRFPESLVRPAGAWLCGGHE